MSHTFAHHFLRSCKLPYRRHLAKLYWRFLAKDRWWITYDDSLKFNVNPTDYLQSIIFFEGYYEKAIVDWIKNNLKKEDVFWDVGANVGILTLIASKICGRVISFEPEPKNLARLEQHISANHLSNTTAVPLALSSENGTAVLGLGPTSNAGMHSLCKDPQEGGSSLEVRTATADSLIDEGTFPCPNVMKIDVEGAELLVFRGASRLLGRPELRAIVFECAEGQNGKPGNEEIVEILLKSGFRIETLGKSHLKATDDMRNYLAIKS